MKAGCLTDHPVSVHKAAIHVSSATAAAEPPEDHPEIRSIPSGFFTGQNEEVSLLHPIANSSKFVFQRRQQPASSRR